MRVQSVSQGAGGHPNEDLVAVFEHGAVTDLLVIDGGSSVAERNYIDEEAGDVVWLTQGFAKALAASLAIGRTQEDSLAMALELLGRDFRQRCAGCEPPLHAWPIAALSWLRITHGETGHHLRLYALGDCKSLVGAAGRDVADLDPYVNPQEAVLQAEIGKLLGEGVTDADTRRARLLPLLRARREAQNMAPAPSILCVRPQGAFDARIREVELAPGASVLAMTDGFYRLVDSYGVYSDGRLLHAALDCGLPALLGELRTHEATLAANATFAVKRADDASAILWTAA